MGDKIVTIYVRIIWCDVSGIRRCRVLISPGGDKISIGNKLSEGVGVTTACMSIPAWGDVVVEGIDINSGGVVGEVRLGSSSDTLFFLPPWSKREIFVLGSFLNPDRTPWICCPQSVLRSVTSHAEKIGFSFQVGFEIEFVLFDKTTKTPIDNTVYCSTNGYDSSFPYLMEVTDAIQSMGIVVEQLHAESGPGQFEIVIKHSDPSSVADHLIITKETICSIATRHNLRASFVPKYQEHSAGNGQHCHISIWKNDKNIFENCVVPAHLFCPSSPSVSGSSSSDNSWVDPIVNNFISGVLNRLDELVMFTAGSPNSKRRLQPHCWAGVFKCWGVNNKEAPLRLPTTWIDAPLTNVEFKLFDATANPHIGLAVVLAAGLTGIARGELLPPPCTVDPGDLSPHDALACGITRIDQRSFDERVMASLPPSIANIAHAKDVVKLARSTAVRDIASSFGGLVPVEVLAAVLAVKDSEFSFFREKDLDEELQTLLYRY